MPDIRNFFGGGGPARAAAEPAPKKSTAKPQSTKKGRARKVVSDEEDEDEEIAQPKTKKSAPVKSHKPVKEEEIEETTSSAYFASNKDKTSKTSTTRTKESSTTNGATRTPTKKSNTSAPSSARRSGRKPAVKSYAENEDDDIKMLVDDDEAGDDDIFAEDYAKTTRKGDDYEEDSDIEVLPTRSKTVRTNGAKSKKVESDDEALETAQIPAHDARKPTKSSASTNRKRKSKDLDDEDEATHEDEDEDEAPKKKARKSTTKTTPKKPRAPANKNDVPESKEMQDIINNIPLVRAPTPPPRNEDRKFKFGGGNAAVAPMAAGSKEIPIGADNCLAGMTFVFTGVLDSLGREEGQNLVKQYGGKVTSGPSSKTSFVVLGNDAGPKKLETIQKLGIKTIDEDGLFHIIKTFPANGGDSKAAEKHAEKQAKEEERIKKEAEEMERKDKDRQKEEAKAAKAAVARGAAPVAAAKAKGPKIDDRLWVDKYAPDSISAVCGNKSVVESLQRWLRNWHNNAKFGFKKAGADGKGIYRAAMIHGPPGIGKTTAAHLIAKLEGYDIVESNASDTRSKKLVEAGLTGVLDTTSLLGYFSGDGKKTDAKKKKLVLIMDEVDGMSAGDRGGVGALAAVAKKTKIPMILICNERRLPKMKPFDFVTGDFAFRRPTTDMIRGRIATICFREGLRLPPQVLNALIEGTNADIRQIINMISTIKLDNKDVDFNDTKAMSKAWEKHIILKPWDIVSKILRPQMFSPSSTATLNDKIELYFNDHEFSYLMLQENYLKTQPSAANGLSPKERNLKLLELASNAAESISDGDLVDRMIHGSQQQWSLMPTHAVFSFVRPASQMYGNFNTQVGFASWLGNNSKQGKLSRFVKEIQGHMRLRSSGDRHEVRQQYLPAIWNKTVKVLQEGGKDSVQDVIDFMDSYYLTKDDFDAMVELGVGPMDQSEVKLETQTKAAFTRLYNSQSHPMPFIKASATTATARAGGTKRDKPDLEEAIEDDEVADEGALEAEVKDEADGDEELDIKKDKYIKAPKKKAAGKAAAGAKAGGAKGKGKGKRTKDDDEDEDDESEDAPKAKKGRAAAPKGKGKAKA